MLRLSSLSTATLVSQLGLKAFQSKLCPLLSYGSICSQDERRYLHSKPNKPLLQPRTLIKSDLCVYHTTPNKNQNSLPPTKDIIKTVQREINHVLSVVDIKEIKKAPVPIQTLGFSGLIPFVLPPLAILLNGQFLPNMAFAQMAYGCCILGFLGGIKWGYTLPEQSADKPTYDNLCLSITWPLVSWVSLLLPQVLGTMTLMGGIAGAAYYDTLKSSYPPWFKALRILLSVVSLASLFLMLLLQIIL